MAENNEKYQRHYDLDWLRVLAIIVLLFFHTGMLFVTWSWHVKNAQTSKAFDTVMIWLHQCRMPLLLFISGAGTYLALEFRNSKQYIKERNKKLLIPLIFGMFFIVPPQIYYERIAQFSSYLDFYPTVFQFVPYPKGGSLSWHHLWFILYLLVYSIMALPVFLWLKKSQAQRTLNRLFKISCKKGGILLWVLPIIISQVILRPFFREETHALIGDWAYFTFYFCFFFFGYLAFSQKCLWQLIKEQRTFNLIAAIIAQVIFYLIYFIPYTLPVKFDYPFAIIKVITAWFWVVTFIGYGQQYLNFSNRFLKYANEAIYPFYILHQTIIIALGYYIVQWHTNIMVKYSLVLTLTFLSCFICYEFIKRFAITRLLFGMKPLSKQSKVEYQIPSNSVANSQIVS